MTRRTKGSAVQPRTRARDAGAWRRWLGRHHASAPEVWLIFARKHTGRPCVTFEQAVEEALCFGWVDSVRKRVDDNHYANRFSPRRTGSRWSLINRRRAESLIAAGRMAPAGLAAVDQARKNGAWAAAAVKRPDHLPEILRGMLAADRRAADAWNGLSPARQRQYNLWVNEAGRDQTRQRRANDVVRQLRR